MVLDANSSQEYPVNPGVPQGSILDPDFFYYTLLKSVYADNTTLYSKCDHTSHLL